MLRLAHNVLATGEFIASAIRPGPWRGMPWSSLWML